MIIKMNQKIKSISHARRIRNGSFVFDVFLENGDIGVWFNNLPFTSFQPGEAITYQLIEHKKYFEPTLKLIKPKQ
tara:strand:+ start:88 stop:312 length:225 start_codon:yes stop_codon:yes gene_type:complete